MYRISPQHLAWALENLVEGRVVNRIQVRPSVKRWAKVALDRMLEVEAGLLDFPCRLDDEVVLLCWRMGETAIEHWHTIEQSGFQGRQPVDERFRRRSTSGGRPN
jgi:hypothetical protein